MTALEIITELKKLPKDTEFFHTYVFCADEALIEYVWDFSNKERQSAEDLIAELEDFDMDREVQLDVGDIEGLYFSPVKSIGLHHLVADQYYHVLVA